MVKVKNIFCFLFLLVLTTSCTSQVSKEDLNKPAKQYFEMYLNRSIDSMKTIEKDSEENIRIFRDYEKSYFDRKMEVRKTILDSIVFDQSSLTIIEKEASGYSGVYQESYFFNNGRCIEVYWGPISKETKKPKFKTGNIEDLQKGSEDIYTLYTMLKKEKSLVPKDKKSFRDTFGEYFITILNENTISYYRTTSYDIGNLKKIEKIK